MKAARFAAAVTALSLAACATIKTDSKMSEGASFAGKATFAMIGAPPGSGRDPAIEQFLGDRVDKEVAARVKAKGYSLSDPEKADLLVATHATMDGKIDAIRWGYTTIGWDTWGPYGYGGTLYTGVVYAKTADYSKGSVVIDVVDAKTHALAYRGWAQGALRVNGEATQDEIRSFVEHALAAPRAALTPHRSRHSRRRRRVYRAFAAFGPLHSSRAASLRAFTPFSAFDKSHRTT